MRIAYLNPSGKLGGAESILLDMLASMREARPDWPLDLILGEAGPVADRARVLGVEVHVIPFPPSLARLGDAGAGGPAGRQIGRLALAQKFLAALPAVLSYRRRLHLALRRLEPRLLHSNGFKMHLLAVWARPTGVPVVWHLHDYVSKRPVMARLLRRYSSRCAAAIANSKSVAADASGVCPGLRLRPVLNAIDLNRFTPLGPKLDLDALAGLPPAPAGTVKVGLVGTLARWKGHSVFLEALAKLPPGLPVRGYVIGGALYQTEGSQWSIEELRGLAARLGIAGRVGFTGFSEEPAAAMRALDIVVHASTQPEPFGLVIVEAMACGRAVIAGQAGGAAELIQDGVDALAHPPGNVAILAQRIERLALDGDLRRKLGSAGLTTAARRFDRARLAGDLIPVYEEVTAKACGSYTSTAGISTAA